MPGGEPSAQQPPNAPDAQAEGVAKKSRRRKQRSGVQEPKTLTPGEAVALQKQQSREINRSSVEPSSQADTPDQSRKNEQGKPATEGLKDQRYRGGFVFHGVIKLRSDKDEAS
jgi:hypothetical protein